MKLMLKREVDRELGEDLAESVLHELQSLSDLVLEAQTRYHVTKLENLLCESPKSDLLLEP